MLSRIVENYLRVIYELEEKKGHVRPIEIARTLCVSAPSVTQMLQKLSKLGFIDYEKRGLVKFTAIGREKAAGIKMRYQVFLKLFEMAGVSPKTAYMDACFIEHQLSEETVTKLVEFVNNLESKK